MKKLLVLLSAILLIFAIGCSNDNPNTPVDELHFEDIVVPETSTELSEDNSAVVSGIIDSLYSATDKMGTPEMTRETLYYDDGTCFASQKDTYDAEKKQNITTLTLQTAVGDLSAGSVIVITTDENKNSTVSINGIPSTMDEFNAEIWELMSTSIQKARQTAEIVFSDINIGENTGYNVVIDYEEVTNAETFSDAESFTGKLAMTLNNPYSGISSLEIIYESNGVVDYTIQERYGDIVCEIADVPYLVTGEMRNSITIILNILGDIAGNL